MKKYSFKHLVAFSFCLLMILGFMMIGSEVVAEEGSVSVTDPLALGDNPIPTLANRLILTALSITGVLALLSFIYGGILYMLVGVNPKNVEKGKEIMKWSVVGLFIIFTSYAILNYILGTVFGLK